jgi:hypothetical protein
MNDFTKEELIWMRDNFRGFMQLGAIGLPNLPIIVNKLNTMINNYCDTPKCEHIEIVTGAYPRSNPPIKCDLCGALYRE